ncbi:hypothetical protein Taro_037160 [Colocasia esculenta]|uniref:Uncharacterized protein n=1 Tax=Colocasia esculenta TaxID=4460 RepID=A0A843WBZ4_COLES|nr:hypothetical protein [Colocasia esculenta]
MAIATAPFSYRSPSLLLLLCLLLSGVFPLARGDWQIRWHVGICKVADVAFVCSCISISDPESTENIHFRRMIVQDADIEVLVKARGHMLIGLKLDKWSGFSTDALRLVARSCSGKMTDLEAEEMDFGGLGRHSSFYVPGARRRPSKASDTGHKFQMAQTL